MTSEVKQIQPKTIVALVPMRHHSERVPGKNYRLLAGKPLFHHILDTLLACPEITRVAVDTDSPVIMDSLREHYPQVAIIERPEHLRADTIPMNEVLLHDTAQIPADLYLQTHSTNPLLRPQTISRAIQRPGRQYPAYDSLFSVTRMQTRLWDQLAARSTITRRFCCARRTCRPSMKKIRAFTCLLARLSNIAATAWASGPACLKSPRLKPGISMKSWIFRSWI